MNENNFNIKPSQEYTNLYINVSITNKNYFIKN